MIQFDHKKLAKKWLERWEADKIYQPDMQKAKKPFYNLMMFPYPSAEGLHIGHVYTFGGIDTFGRFKRMQGYDVFEPIGLDAFGIHSENYALKTNTNPADLSPKTEENFYRQLKMMANSYDWSHTVETNKPDYYKWTQWLFLQLYKKGLVERKEAPVNWCPSCLTVLSDEQVIGGKCERCNSEVIVKQLAQWFIKITDYAERLLENLETIDWDPAVKLMQKNWIGKKVGAEITFDIKNHTSSIKVFTTRADTLYGVTAVVLSPEHPLAETISTEDCINDALRYIKASTKKSEVERMADNKVKTGVKTGRFAIHPLTQELIPIYIADYIIGGYGTGAIMLVPAHDQRDFEFAKAFNIDIKAVVKGLESDDDKNIINNSDNRMPISSNKVFDKYGVLINSEAYTGMDSEKASEKIVDQLEKSGLGKTRVQYHLRDWLISRQRYWGPPIPIIYCNKCGPQPVPENQLPVVLPYIDDFRPTGTGKSPLANHPDFYNVKCPNCEQPAVRETDVSDTFLDSSWYFLRYPSVGDDTKPFDTAVTKKWLPVDSYIGGKEHSVLHLLYSRFVAMVLYDMDYIDFEEPFPVFRANGLLIKDGMKMSKSRGNVINPDEYIEKYGIDIVRCYLLFIGPFSEGGDWRDSGLAGIERFINRIWLFVQTANMVDIFQDNEQYVLHKSIKKVTEDFSNLRYNTAIAAIMELLNALNKQPTVHRSSVETLIQLLAPLAPTITEQLWEMIGQSYSVHQSSWPIYNEAFLAKDEFVLVVQINGKMRDKLLIAKDMPQAEVEAKALKQEKIQGYLKDKVPIRLIYVPGKLLNIVV